MIALRDATDADLVGSKAATLARLLTAGIVVPDGFVVPANVKADADSISAMLSDMAERDQPIECTSGLFACRSSFAGEDGGTRSYAGIFHSVVNVSPTDIAEAIDDVLIESSKAMKGEAYVGGSTAALEGSVIVQEMVSPCDRSGIAFSLDPVSGEDCVLVEEVEGLNVKLTAGEATPTAVYRVPPSAVGGAHPPYIRKLAKTVRHVAELLDCPVDVEWAVQGGRIILLQARPITRVTTAAGDAYHFWFGGNAPVWIREAQARTWMEPGFAGCRPFTHPAGLHCFVHAGSCYMEGWVSESSRNAVKQAMLERLESADGFDRLLGHLHDTNEAQEPFFASYEKVELRGLSASE